MDTLDLSKCLLIVSLRTSVGDSQRNTAVPVMTSSQDVPGGCRHLDTCNILWYMIKMEVTLCTLEPQVALGFWRHLGLDSKGQKLTLGATDCNR